MYNNKKVDKFDSVNKYQSKVKLMYVNIPFYQEFIKDSFRLSMMKKKLRGRLVRVTETEWNSEWKISRKERDDPE